MPPLTIQNPSIWSAGRCAAFGIESKWWPEHNGRTLPKAWRLMIVAQDGHKHPLPMAFGRESDVRQAIAALERNGIDTLEAVRIAGRETLERTVAEAMSW